MTLPLILPKKQRNFRCFLDLKKVNIRFSLLKNKGTADKSIRMSFIFSFKKTKWRIVALLLVLLGVKLSWFFFLNKEGRNPAGFSKAEMEYAETLLEGEEEVDPDLDTGSPYEDTLSVPRHEYKDTVEELLEDSRMTDYKRALTEEISETKTQRVKKELAKRIIERNREEGYEIVLDEDFNVISAKRIKSEREKEISPKKSEEAPK